MTLPCISEVIKIWWTCRDKTNGAKIQKHSFETQSIITKDALCELIVLNVAFF